MVSAENLALAAVRNAVVANATLVATIPVDNVGVAIRKGILKNPRITISIVGSSSEGTAGSQVGGYAIEHRTLQCEIAGDFTELQMNDLTEVLRDVLLTKNTILAAAHVAIQRQIGEVPPHYDETGALCRAPRFEMTYLITRS